MLVNRGIINDDLETRERQLVEAFALGFADKIHFDGLADMRNVLLIAAAHRDDTPIVQICRAMSVAMNAIRDRHTVTSKFGATGEEMKMLRVFCNIYKDWWLRQPVELYESACDSLQRQIYAN